jgi:hypothetical protein
MYKEIKLPQVEIPERGLHDVFVDLVLRPIGLEDEIKHEPEWKS